MIDRGCLWKGHVPSLDGKVCMACNEALSADVPKVRARWTKLDRKGYRGQRLRIWERDGPWCRYCSRKLDRNTFTIDHFWPLSKGGSTKDWNCIIACARCNVKKGNTEPTIWTFFQIALTEEAPYGHVEVGRQSA